MAFLDGEADQDLTLHLQQCPHCRERVETLKREQKLLTSHLFRISCPSSTELGEYHLHMLPPEQMLMISQHLRHCPSCNREIEQLKEFLTDLAPGSEGGLLKKTKLLIAQLVSGAGIPGALGQPSFALRGKSEDTMTFEVGGILIVIDIQKGSDGKLNILGQVATAQQDDWTNAAVKLHQEDQPERNTAVDDLGTFQFDDLLPSPMDIKIEAKNGTVIVVPTIDDSG
jgi:hypothetical protein